MREIKFRAWSKKAKKMGAPFIPFLMDRKHGAVLFSQEELVDEISLMQFTGLKDKNGKEIYEGDIVRRPADGNLPRKSYEVRFEDGAFQAWPYGRWNEVCEVIGNIYENPELLTK